MKKKKFLRIVAFFMALNIIFEVISPTVAMALTSGPIQPEFTGFEPANSSEMVDLFTGDFKYNIPLMDVDGYPLNISYHAGQNMESEASWVGLGWSLNPGVLNRVVKGLPDDFLGEQIESRTNIKPFAQMGVGYQFSAWIGANMNYANTGVGGKVGANGAVVLSYNNYKGYGLEIEMDAHASLTTRAGGVYMTNGGGVGMSLSSQDGGTLSYNHSHGVGVSFELPYGTAANIGVNYGEGKSINTRSGAATKSTFGGASVGAGGVNISATISHVLPVGPVSYAPRISNDFLAGGMGLSVKAGLWGDVKFQLNGYTLPFSVNGGLLMGFKGFYNLSKLKDKNRNLPAYGYLYAEKAPTNSLMDFNRFRDGSIFEQTPNISLSSQTYDIFSASGQGIGSNFRAFRSDNGTNHDNTGQNISANIHDAGEIGGIFLVHINNDFSTNVTVGNSGSWNTLLNNSLSYKEKDIQVAANRFYEKYYFKQMGEIAARDGSFDGAIGGEAAVSPILIKKGDDYHATSPISGAPRTKRDVRNTYIESLTAEQAKKYGYEPTINLYDKNTFTINSNLRSVDKSTTVANTNIDRTTKAYSLGSTNINANLGHHLSEISLTNTSGAKYTYGIPVYNLYKKTVIFNASNRVETPYLGSGFPATSYSQNALLKSNAYQLVEYDPSGGKEIDNNYRGSDNHYQHNITPAYATSYLLTSIASPDYIDVKGDGPSYDDLGSYTKFNYYKAGEFGWREPFCYPATQSNKPTDWTGSEGGLTKSKEQANFDIGAIADELDDRASYEFGIRENYYTHSIETKNYVAFFETSDREDAKGVDDENGTVSTNKPLKLDNIKLYSKSEIIAKGGVAGAIPIKTVKFEYEYSLCPGTFNSTYNGGTNSDRGKLTLKKIRFTYGNSDKSALSPYTFNYTSTSNFPYNPTNVDRWGNYSPNSGSATGAPGTLNNTEYPYTVQNKSLADAYSQAWNLTEITTPTGSKIKVSYESDDYGYVQNEQAGQMLKIVNVLTNSSFNPNADASLYPANINLKNSEYLLVDLQALRKGIPVATYSTSTLANNFVKSNLIKLNKRLYYKCFMKIAGPGNSFGLTKSYYDYVPGYAKVLNAGVFTNSQSNNTYTDAGGNVCYKYAYIRLKKEIAFDTKDVNPIVYAGWDYTRNFLPRVAYPGSEPANMGDASHKPLKQFKNALVGLGVALSDFINGVSGSPNKRFYNKNFCNEMDYDKSFIRAYVPFKNKLGGGYRVKQLTTEDGWDNMTSSQETKTTYGQTYDYTVTEGKLNISSGVAIYEPILGGDEISLRKPIDFEIEKMMAPNDHYYQEEPLGEMMYPAPLVGYSKVTVTTMPDPGATTPPTNVCKIGKTEYEFYTAKDFPIIAQRTGLSKRLLENDLIEDFIINTSSIKIFHAAQGHILKFNDMHGKLRSIRSFGEDNPAVAISGVTYTYKASGAANGSKQLITSVQTINENNQIATVNMSRDIDISTDTKENINESITTGTSFLMEIGLIINFITLPTPPYLMVIPYPQIPNINNGIVYGQQKFGSRTATITKVVQQYGILEKTESFDGLAKTTTENLLWDKNTGEVALTKTTNNFDQPVYNYNYSAYWMYPQLGHEFKRDGIEILCKAYNATTNPNPIWNFSTPTPGGILQTSITNPLLLTTGDEVIIMNTSGTKIGGRFWVQKDLANYSANNYHYLMDADGNIANTSAPYNLSSSTDYVIKVVKPVDENNLTESAGYVTSILDPSVSPSIPNIINYTGAGQKIIDAKALRFCSSPSFFIKTTTGHHLTNIGSNYNSTNFNLLTTGFQKKFRPTQSYAYNTERSYNSQPNMKKDGFYSQFTPFWSYTSGQWTKSFTNWVNINNNKLYSPYGYLVESEDGILLPSAQKYCFNHTLPALSANNATYGEVGFESFEEYYSGSNIYTSLSSIDYTNINNGDVLGFYRQVTGASSSPPAFNSSYAHTGRTSLLFSSGNTVKLKQDLLKSYQLMRAEYEYQNECLPSIRNLNSLNLVNKKYLVSMWVKGATTQSLNYSNLVDFKVTVNYNNSPAVITPVLSNPGSPVINGWQKLDYEFTIPTGINPQYVELTLGTTPGSSYYADDFRLQPYNSSMICNVYDPLSLRLWAQMDDQNYATVMEYDNEGMLVRKKKETYKGMYTTQESRKSSVKN